MTQKTLESAEPRGQVPDQVLIPQLSLQSMFWRPKYQNDSNWLVHVPVAFWLVEAAKPQRLVELGSGDGASWFAFCQAVERVVPFAECTGFTAAAPDESLVQYTQEQYQEFATLEQATQPQALERLAPESIDLLHIAPGIARYIEKKWGQWQARLSPRAVVVISQAGAGQPGEALFQRLKALYPHFLFQQGDGLAVVAAGAQQGETLQRLVSFSSGQQAHRLIQLVFSRLGLACLAKPGQSPEQLRVAEALQHESDKLKEANAELQQRLEATAREREELAEHNRAHQQEQQARYHEIAKLTQRLQQTELSAKATEQALEKEVDSLKRELVAERNARQQAQKQAQEQLRQQTAQLQQQLRNQQKENEYLLGEQQRRFNELAELTRRLESKDQQLERVQAYLKTQPAQAKGWRLGRAGRKRQEEMQLVQASGLFNEAWYLEHYPEVKRHRLAPLEYFLQHGGQARHSPGPDFDTAWYLSEYPDVAESGMHPLLHYLKFGRQEARQTTPDAVARS